MIVERFCSGQAKQDVLIIDKIYRLLKWSNEAQKINTLPNEYKGEPYIALARVSLIRGYLY